MSRADCTVSDIEQHSHTTATTQLKLSIKLSVPQRHISKIKKGTACFNLKQGQNTLPSKSLGTLKNNDAIKQNRHLKITAAIVRLGGALIAFTCTNSSAFILFALNFV